MKCPKCGADNIEGSSFCVKCGTNIKAIQNENVVLNNVAPLQNQNNNIQGSVQKQTIPGPVNATQVQPTMSGATQSTVTQAPVSVPTQQLTSSGVQNQAIQNASNVSLNFFAYIIAVLLRPFKCLKEEELKLKDTKNSIILTAIISIIMMLITLIKSMLAVIFTKTMDYSTYKMKSTIDFGNLKDLDWVSLIFKNLLIYAAIIFAIATIYYLASLVFKKETSFTKTLSISASSAIPFILLSMIISPLLGKIWAPLAIVSMVAGTVYSLLIFIFLMDSSITFDNNDTKLYFHLICLSIIGVAGYYAYIKLISSLISVDSQLDSILNMFN